MSNKINIRRENRLLLIGNGLNRCKIGDKI